ncbi:SCND3 protein, partial [Polyodon spathula]|nr:SCND3 protein [Polyodon spathula]
MKPSKMICHLETKHPNLKEKQVKFFQWKRDEVKPQQKLLHATSTNEGMLKASHLLALCIAKKEVSGIPLSNDTVSRRITEIKEHILPLSTTQGTFWYPRDCSFHPILDLSLLNGFLKERKSRMLTHCHILQSIRPGDWFTTVDLRDAYFHVPICPEHRKYLRFSFLSSEYKFVMLPFGLTLGFQSTWTLSWLPSSCRVSE